MKRAVLLASFLAATLAAQTRVTPPPNKYDIQEDVRLGRDAAQQAEAELSAAAYVAGAGGVAGQADAQIRGAASQGQVVQAQILALMREVQQRRNIGLVFISHNLAVVSEMADEIVVMQSGKIVERDTPTRIFTDAQHPYTRKLMRATPKPGGNLRDLHGSGDATPGERDQRHHPQQRRTDEHPRQQIGRAHV